MGRFSSRQPSTAVYPANTLALYPTMSNNSNADVENKADYALDAKNLGSVDIIPAFESREPPSLQGLSEEERERLDTKLTRKMDLIIMPVIGILYILNYIDRQNLAAAKVQGIMEDLNLTTEQFASAISILFVGYLPFQIPSNLLISRISRPGLYICVCACIWGAISAATAAVKDYPQLMIIRTFLGVVEAVFFPGAIFFLSSWYPRRQLGKRIAGLYIAQQFGNAFGGLLAAAVLTMQGVHGLHGWQWLFIIEGAATVGIAGLATFLMPEYPHNAKILNTTERELAVWRIESESGAVSQGSEEEGVLQSFISAFKDPKLWMLIFMNMMSQVQGSIANFFPTIVQGLGYGRTLTLVLTAPPYIFAGFCYYGISYYSDRHNTVYRPILILICGACAMYIVSLATVNVGARYFAMMCLPFTSVGPQILLFKIINVHLARPSTKRAAASALVNAIGGTSNIWMSYLYIGAPRFFPAFGALFGAAGAFAIMLTVYRWHIMSENKKLDSGDPAQISQVIKRGVTEEMVALGWRYEMF